MCAESLQCVWLFVTLWTWTVACWEYWGVLPCPPPGDLPDPVIKPMSLMFPALAGRFFTTSATWEAPYKVSLNEGASGDAGSIPESERFPGEENGNPLQYSCLENPMDRGAWWTKVHGVTKSQTRMKQLSMHIREALGRCHNFDLQNVHYFEF